MLDIDELIKSVFRRKPFSRCRFYVQTNIRSKFSNVVTGEYLQQKEILCIYLFKYFVNLFSFSAKTNTKVFISHCGINSVNEVFYKLNMNH